MNKISTRFSGKKVTADQLVGKVHTIVDIQERKSRKFEEASSTYFDVQAIVKNEGLVRYTTGASLLVPFFKNATLPIRDVRIVKDWRGVYFEGTVLTEREEEELKRKKFGIYDD